MNATQSTRVEIDDKIREQPELLRAVNEATRYLKEQAEEVPPPALVGWRFADEEGKLLELTLRDGSETLAQTVRHNYWTRWILDPVSRKICVLKAWAELLGNRSDKNLIRIKAQITELISQLPGEESDGR